VPTIAGYITRQKLFESPTTVLFSAHHPTTGRTVMLKLLKGEHPNNERLNRFRREYALLSSFDSDAIVRTYGLENHLNSLVIVLEDCLGHYDLLSEVLKGESFTLEQFLRIGVDMTQALVAMHDSRIICRRCNPMGILISKDRRKVKFIDFSFATEEDELLRENRETIPPEAIIPYISPEQTGRIEQPVDYRSDLYSLGVTLFQLACGSLPFRAKGPGELIHAHLAKRPPAPASINATIPGTVSAIILKLLEKSPAKRYQTTRGILHDLRRCRQNLLDSGSISDFRPGMHDFCRTLELPTHLCSREQELELLKNRLASAAGGRLETVCITGPEGVGKSSLAKSFAAGLSREKTYFLSARFTPTNPPHAPIGTAIRQLVHFILSEDGNALDRRQARILREIGDEGPVLAAAFPETLRLIGDQQPPATPDAFADEPRLSRVLGKFLHACGETGPVLVLFLDDLHHADATSLELLANLLGPAHIGRMLFLGAYRNEDATLDTPLAAFLRRSAVTNPDVCLLQLENLQLPDIAELLSVTLSRKRREVGELAGLCLQKTGGNPYFLRQFLRTVHRDGHLLFAADSQRWEWDAAAINKSHLTPNAAESIKQRIPALPAPAGDFLRTAACLGDSCSLELVGAILCYHPEKELEQVFSEGLMFMTGQEDGSGQTAPRLRFAHARIREAALGTLNPVEQSVIRLRAGRHLLYTLSPEQYPERLQEIADYLGGDHVRRIASRTERLEIARVHLDAGKQSRSRDQFHNAHRLLVAGVQSLPEGSWKTDYVLTLELYTEACAGALHIGDYPRMDRYFHEVCAEVRDILDACKVFRLRIRSLKARGEPDKAVATCREILAMLGVILPAAPGRLACLASLLNTRILLLSYGQERLLALPDMKDRKALAIMGFLREAATAAYTASPRLLPYLCAHGVRLSMRYGNCQESSIIGYLTFGFLLCSLSPATIEEGYRFGRLALQMLKRFSHDELFGQPPYAYCTLISHWKEHLRESLPPLRQSMRGYYGRGDADATANTACSICLRHYLLGTNLNRLAAEIDDHLELVRNLNQHLAIHRLGISGQAVAALQGKTADPVTLTGRYFNEEEMLHACRDSGDGTTFGLAMIIKMIHAVLFHDWPRALRYSEMARKHLGSLTASVILPVYYFYDSLARLAGYERQSSADKLHTRFIVARNQRKMRRWARHAPQNYAHKYLLVEAERKRVLSLRERAMELYDNAIHLAHENEYINEEALAYELAARFYSNRQKPHIARLYLREARYCYYRWGATAKVGQLDSHEESGGEGARSTAGSLPWTAPLIATAPGEGASRLDMLTVIKASRILSGETVLEELLKKMMRIMLESGGAQKGALVFREGGEWLIRVWGYANRRTIINLTSAPVNDQNIASTAIINYVLHAVQDVVLDDACKEGNFTNDVYVLEKKPRSVLCMPIVYQGDIFCILYLENNLAAGTFPPDRQELLHLLGVQAAISLKNALLFEELEHTVGRLNQEIAKRRTTQQQLLHAEKLSALGRLSASIAHEFGNPLMGVKYLLDDFHQRRNLADGDRQLLELGLEECDRMKKLIRDLQRLNKPSSGKKSWADIHQLIDHVLLFQKKHFSTHRIRLRTEYDPALPKVEVIVDQITQVLFNLTMNAVDAMAREGGTLTVATRRNKNDLLVVVADTGSGIAYEHQEQIFEPFFSTKREEDGTGLGLSISYGIARHHGGNLSFASEPDQGTTFTLTIPLSPRPVTEAAMEFEHKN